MTIQIIRRASLGLSPGAIRTLAPATEAALVLDGEAIYATAPNPGGDDRRVLYDPTTGQIIGADGAPIPAQVALSALVSGDGNMGRLRAIFDETNIRQGYPLFAYPRSAADHGAVSTFGGGTAPTVAYETQDGIPVATLTTQNTGSQNGAAQFDTLAFSRVVSNGTITLLVYCADSEVAKFSALTVLLGNDSSFVAHFSAQKNLANASQNGHGGWHLIRFHPQAANDGTNDYSGLSADTFQARWVVGAGSPSWASAMVLMRLRINPVSKTDPVTVKVAGAWVGDYAARSPIVFTLDDGYAEHYTTFAPIMERYGLRASFGIIGQAIGTANYMTEAQLSDLVARGHEMVVHGCLTGKNNLSEYATQAEIEADIAYHKAFVSRFSTNNSHLCYIYPQGIAEHSNGDTRIRAALDAQGMIGARRTNLHTAIQLHRYYAYNDIMYLPIVGHTWNVTDEAANIARMQVMLQANADKGQPSIIVNHKIAAVPSNGQEITAANFEVICQKAANLIASGQAINMTMNTLVQGLRALRAQSPRQ
jgi:peptidoglycan/xylan/chitin deacetylase (PgdA/CDA1 family)